MSFRRYLAESAGDFFQYPLRPSQADTWSAAVNSASSIDSLRSKWKSERDGKEGRPLHNIDLAALMKVPFISMKSAHLPGTGPGHDPHREDSGPSIRAVDSEFGVLAPAPGGNARIVPEPGVPDLPDNLDALFGPAPPPPGDLPSDFDEPWVRPADRPSRRQ